MRARAGEELLCRAKNFEFDWGRGRRTRGVTSYYATRALAAAGTCGEWLSNAAELADADARSGLLPETHHRLLQVLGDAACPVIGRPATP
jgi:hypothetical protein